MDVMTKIFKHPLARNATLAKLHPRDGDETSVLVVVTTLTLEPDAKGYSAKNIARLHEAARAFVAQTEGVTAYALVNRPKEWDR